LIVFAEHLKCDYGMVFVVTATPRKTQIEIIEDGTGTRSEGFPPKTFMAVLNMNYPNNNSIIHN
jgi:hypothetical protein